MDIKTSLTQYLEAVTGQTPVIQPLPKQAHAGLPIYLNHSYTLYELYLFGVTLILAVMNEDSAAVDLAQVTKDREQLTNILTQAVILVLPQIRSYERKRLVERNVPFIVPGRQMFLPMLLVDLRESFPVTAIRPPAHLGWVAQVIILRQLLRGDMTDRPLTGVATLLGYSKMAITQAMDQMLALELCREAPAGRSKMIEFTQPAGALWLKAQPYLRSPVKRRYFIKWLNEPVSRPLYAGLRALAELTDLAAGVMDTLAMNEGVIRRLLAEGKGLASPLKEDAHLAMEGWAYHPELLATGATVDPLSLYLSLKNDSDERVQMALDRLVERWSPGG